MQKRKIFCGIAACFFALLLAGAGKGALPACASSKTEVIEADGGVFTLVWGEAQAAQNTNTGWWQGTFGRAELPEGDGGVQYVYSRQHNKTDNAILMTDLFTGEMGIFYPFGPLGEFPENWQKEGTVRYFLNGERAEDLQLKTGDEAPSSPTFWQGKFTLSFFRYAQVLHVLCDFVRTGEEYHLLAEYRFAVASPLEICLGGNCSDLSGTVAYAQSVSFQEITCAAAGHLWGEWRLTEQGEEERLCSRCGEKESRLSERAAAFRAAAEEIGSAATQEQKLEAIRSACTIYAALSAGEREKAAEAVQLLRAEIAAYNALSNSANEQFDLAAEVASGCGAAGAAAAGLALVWFLLKKGA